MVMNKETTNPLFCILHGEIAVSKKCEYNQPPSLIGLSSILAFCKYLPGQDYPATKWLLVTKCPRWQWRQEQQEQWHYVSAACFEPREGFPEVRKCCAGTVVLIGDSDVHSDRTGGCHFGWRFFFAFLDLIPTLSIRSPLCHPLLWKNTIWSIKTWLLRILYREGRWFCILQSIKMS